MGVLDSKLSRLRRNLADAQKRDAVVGTLYPKMLSSGLPAEQKTLDVFTQGGLVRTNNSTDSMTVDAPLSAPIADRPAANFKYKEAYFNREFNALNQKLQPLNARLEQLKAADAQSLGGSNSSVSRQQVLIQEVERKINQVQSSIDKLVSEATNQGIELSTL
jgi:hypothetical protein